MLNKTRISLLLLGVAGAGGCREMPSGVEPENTVARAAVSPQVIVAGLDNPRGIAFGPDGNLYVAEAGVGGTSSTAGSCPQNPFPIGPYTGGLTGKVSMINSAGQR